METKRWIGTEKVCDTDGTWAQATRKGKFVFVSGQVGGGPDGEMVSNDFEAQARQALENLKSMLEQAGASMKDLMLITTFVTDMKNRPAFAKVRSEFFTENPPASTIVEINQLYAPEVLVEVNGIAVLDD